MTPAQLEIPQQLQGPDAFGAAFTHAQQQPRGERDTQAPSLLELSQANLQTLAGGAGMQGLIGRTEPLQHQPHRGIAPAKARHFLAAQGARIRVGKSALIQGKLTEPQQTLEPGSAPR